MSKMLLGVIAVSVVTSSAMSILVTLAFERNHLLHKSRVLRTTKLEIVDAAGRTRGTFGMYGTSDREVPQLTLLDVRAGERLKMSTDRRGDAALEFASDRWNEGAVVIGHLVTSDLDAGDEGTDEWGNGWGLMVRGHGNALTRMGFLNSGQNIAPVPESTPK